MTMAAPSAESVRPAEEPDPEVPERARQRRYSAAYKVRVLNEYEGLERSGKGALLRREGLYSSLISEWRKQRDQGALAAFSPKRGRPEVDPREREMARFVSRWRAWSWSSTRPRRWSRSSQNCQRSWKASRPRVRKEGASRQHDRERRGRAGGGGGHCRCLPGGRPPAGDPLPTPAPAGAQAPTRAAAPAAGAAARGALRHPRAPELGALCGRSAPTVYAKLLDEGRYLGSVSTMYRILRSVDEVRERRRVAVHPAYVKPELIAERPNQVWSWV